MNKINLILRLSFGFLLCFGLFAFEAQAATLTVTSTSDTTIGAAGCGDGCSLREAIAAAASGDTIVFSSLFNTAQTINLPNGQLAVGKNLTINGKGANILTIQNTKAASSTSSVFFVSANFTLTLSGLRITGGNTPGPGGGINADGNVMMTNCTVSGNTGQLGGGISIGGTLNLTNSTISGNTSTLDSGGIDTFFNTVTIINSTVSGNTSGRNGGGIYGYGATISLTNSTVTNNSAATNGSGIYADAGTAYTIRNTIIAANVSNQTKPDTFNIGGTISSNGYNLIGNRGSVAFGTIGDQSGTSGSPLNPQLGALADNGGTTQTHSLLANSPAIDKGISSGSTTDQRGVFRTYNNPGIANALGGDGTDIGAFEVQGPSAAGTVVGGRVIQTNGRGIFRALVTMTDSQGNQRQAFTNQQGYYQFEDVAGGQVYVFMAQHRRYSFDQPTQVEFIGEETNGINFVGTTSGVFRFDIWNLPTKKIE